MMSKEPTPKEKASELLDKFREHAIYWDCRNDEPTEVDHARLCAIITVNEILGNDETQKNNEVWYDNVLVCETEYWEKVKEELETVRE